MKRAIILLILTYQYTPIFSATFCWNGDGDGINWSDPDNWDTDMVPGSSDEVKIEIDSTVIQSGENFAIQSLNLTNGARLNIEEEGIVKHIQLGSIWNPPSII